MEFWYVYLILGVVAGWLAGLLGVGGGLVIVPVLAEVFVVSGFPAATIMHQAIATSLATIVLTSIASAYTHHRHGAIRWEVFRQIMPGILVGAFLAAILSRFLSSGFLKIFFALFELWVAAQMWFSLRPRAVGHLPGRAVQFAAGTVIGLISSWVGIGGGTLTVPYLYWARVPLRQAVATSAACGLPIAVAGLTGYLVISVHKETQAMSFGYLYWPAMVGISLTSLFTAPVGARMAHRIPVGLLKRIFALVLLFIGLRMLLS